MFGKGSARRPCAVDERQLTYTRRSHATYTSKTTLVAKWWTVARSRIESNVREVAYGRIR